MRIQTPTLRQWLQQLIAVFQQAELLSVAARLSYTTILTIVPLFAVILSLFTAFPMFADFQVQVEQFMAQNLIPQTLSHTISDYLSSFASQASKITTTGSIFLFVTSIFLIQTIDKALNTIAKVKRHRPLVQRILVYWAVLSLGPILLGMSLWVIAKVSHFNLGIRHDHYNIYANIDFFLFVLGFTLIYYIVPNRQIFFKDAFIGGIIVTILLHFMKNAFAWYIIKFPTYSLIYGAFATIPLFLIWMYVSWIIILLGAIIATNLPLLRMKDNQYQHKQGHFFMNALFILQYLMHSRQQEQTAKNLLDISHATHITLDDCMDILQHLKTLNYVEINQNNEWVLICSDDITIDALVNRLLLDRQYQNLFRTIGIHTLFDSHITLQQLLAELPSHNTLMVASNTQPKSPTQSDKGIDNVKNQ